MGLWNHKTPSDESDYKGSDEEHESELNNVNRQYQREQNHRPNKNTHPDFLDQNKNKNKKLVLLNLMNEKVTPMTDEIADMTLHDHLQLFS